MIRIGFIGVNHGHETPFLDVINGDYEKAFPILNEAKVIGISGFEEFKNHWMKLGKDYKLKIVSSKPEDVIKQSDAIMVLSYDYKKDENYVDYHKDLAIAAMEAGKPTFVDKPIANCMKDIRMMYEVSERSGVPLYCSSSMRTDPGLASIKDRLSEVGDIRFVRCTIFNGPLIGYGIHGTEMIQEVLGRGAKRVNAKPFGSVKGEIINIDYEDDKIVILEHFCYNEYLYQIQVFGTLKTLDSGNLHVVNPRIHYAHLFSKFLKMIKDWKSPIGKEDTLESHSIVIGAELSLKNGRIINLDEL